VGKLDRNVPSQDAIGALAKPDHSHSALAKVSNQPVGTDRPAGERLDDPKARSSLLIFVRQVGQAV
jgi:hypothetical protein